VCCHSYIKWWKRAWYIWSLINTYLQYPSDARYNMFHVQAVYDLHAKCVWFHPENVCQTNAHVTRTQAMCALCSHRSHVDDVVLKITL
jgi:hypothetical protein